MTAQVDRVRAWQRRQRALGRCRSCRHGKPDINPRTGKPKWLCPACAEQTNATRRTGRKRGRPLKVAA